MAGSGWNSYLDVKNERILVCPFCGSPGYKSHRIITKKPTSKNWSRSKKENRYENKYYCRHCSKEFNALMNLQEWLTIKFNETREKEKLNCR